MKVATVTNKSKHLGNFKISVSFDLYGDADKNLTEGIIDVLQVDITNAFNSWYRRWNKHLKIDNVRWNQ